LSIFAFWLSQSLFSINFSFSDPDYGWRRATTDYDWRRTTTTPTTARPYGSGRPDGLVQVDNVENDLGVNVVSDSGVHSELNVQPMFS